MVSGVAGFFIAVVVVSVSILILYVGYTQIRARKLGLPPPTVSSYNPFQSNNLDPYASNSGGGGVVGWFKSKYQNLRNSRTTSGGYETSRHADDNAWDAQAEYGYEPEFDDSRLQQNTAYNARSGAGGSYNMNLAGASVEEESRGRSRSREPGPEPRELILLVMRRRRVTCRPLAWVHMEVVSLRARGLTSLRSLRRHNRLRRPMAVRKDGLSLERRFKEVMGRIKYERLGPSDGVVYDVNE